MSFKQENVVCGCLQNSLVLLPYKDIELLIFFSVVYRIGLGSPDLSFAIPESPSYSLIIFGYFKHLKGNNY